MIEASIFQQTNEIRSPFFLKMEVEPASECCVFSTKPRRWKVSMVLKWTIIEQTEEFITWLILMHWILNVWLSGLWYFQKLRNITGMLLSRFWSYRLWYHVFLWAGTDVSVEHCPSIFRVKVCMVRNQLNYIGKLQERWSQGVGQEMESSPDQ
jgi:hypothetical protein